MKKARIAVVLLLGILLVLGFVIFVLPTRADVSLDGWALMSSGTTYHLSDVWGPSSSDVFAVGEGGTIQHYDGNAWSAMSSGTTDNLRGIYGSSSSNVFAGGDSGIILHYDGYTWRQVMTELDGVPATAFLAPIVDIAVSPDWGEDTAIVVATADNIYASDNGGIEFTTLWEPSFQPNPVEGWVNINSLDMAPDEEGDNIVAVLVSDDSGIYLTEVPYENWVYQHCDPSSDMVLDLFFSPNYAVDGQFIGVGEVGTIFYHNDIVCNAIDSGTSNSLYGVWGTSFTNLFAVGVDGTILHYNGSIWSSMSSGTSNSLYSVWGTSSSDVYAVGDGGTILHYWEQPPMLTPTPTPTQTPNLTPSPSPSPSPLPTFNIGDNVRTTGDLNIRSDPWIDDNVVETMLKGSTGIILDGPRTGINYIWWKVQYDTCGVTGWSAQDWLAEKPQEPSQPANLSPWAKVAINWARAREGSERWRELCLQFVANAFMLEEVDGKSGWGSAVEAAGDLWRFDQGHDGWLNAPVGGLIFFDRTEYNPYGHVAIYLGDKEVIHAYGNVSIDKMEKVVLLDEGRLIGSYIGWSYPPEEWRPNFISAEVHSPVELRVYDSQGRVTGVVNREEKNEIPNAGYCDNTVTMFSPTDSYTYEIEGIGEGSYDVTVTKVTDEESTTFTATGLPASLNAVHQYSIDWDIISQGEEGVTLQIDSDGDGTFESTITADSDLTRDEYLSTTEGEEGDIKEGVPIWLWPVVGFMGALLLLLVAVVYRLKFKQHAVQVTKRK